MESRNLWAINYFSKPLTESFISNKLVNYLSHLWLLSDVNIKLAFPGSASFWRSESNKCQILLAEFEEELISLELNFRQAKHFLRHKKKEKSHQMKAKNFINDVSIHNIA